MGCSAGGVVEARGHAWQQHGACGSYSRTREDNRSQTGQLVGKERLKRVAYEAGNPLVEVVDKQL